MTGNKWLLSNVLPFSLDLVTFKDGAKESVLGSGSLNVPGLPKVKDVLLVDGLESQPDKSVLVNFVTKICS